MEIVVRASVMFVAIYLLLRALGKRELGQMTPFELVVIVVMGDLIQQGVTHNDFSLTGAILALCTFGFWGALLSWIGYLFPRAEKVLDGEPRVLVQDGRVLEHNLRRDRITRSEFESEMRLAGIGFIDEVGWAILEPNGKISFIARETGRDTRQTDEQDAA